MTADHLVTEPSTLVWEAPGPGSWILPGDHYPRPVTAAHEAFLEVWSDTTTGYMRGLGLPIREARMVAVNGLPYVSFVPEGRGGAPPPAWVMRLAVRLLPSLRRAEKRLARLLAERPWVDGVRRWYEVDRDRAVQRMTDRTRIDPGTLDDASLAAHIRDCDREALDSGRQHLELHAHDEPPTLLFAVQMVDWGFEASEALALLAGSSPASTGASPELDALRAAVGGRPAGSLADLRALGDEVATKLDVFLERHGWRLVDGYDVDGPCLAELPSLVVALATATPPTDLSTEQEAAVDRARARVPAEHRDEFDRLLAEARAAYGLRDDNSAILGSWAGGLLRRAMRAAGARLAERGELDDPEVALEATPAQLAAALEGVASVDETELIRRRDFRRSLRAADAPRTLGPPEPPIPTGLPGALGKIMRAFALAIPSGEPRPALRGVGIGTEAYEGRARLVTGAGRGIDTFQPGEVLVAAMTSPSYNIVLSLAGAVVTEEGDVMSHAAIMARELGLPAVVGAPGATTEIRDGDAVTVDPRDGSVHVRRPDPPVDSTT